MDRTGEGPSPEFLLGTDLLGRDILARTLSATRLSLVLAVSATVIAMVGGFPLGAMIALLGPRLRTLGSRVIDTTLSFPVILVIVVITVILEPGPLAAVVAIGIAWIPWLSRISFTLASSIAGRDYIECARVIGIRPSRLLVRYILPNFAETIIITMCTVVGSILIMVSSLSFLGLGVQPPDYDWGRLLIEGVSAIYIVPTAALAPAFTIAITGLSLGFLGEALARAMNPLLWTQATEETRLLPVASVVVTNCIATASPPRPYGSSMAHDSGDLLEVHDLSVVFPSPQGDVVAVDNSSFRVDVGEVVGIVGESGSGKTMTGLAVSQLVPYPGKVTATSLKFRGEDLLSAPPKRLNIHLGTEMAMVFQDPMSSLNPALRIGLQLIEASMIHRSLARSHAIRIAVERLRDVQMPAPEARLRQYPHELSGGMRQRAMIAMGLMNQPSLIIADEPTTSLDVTIQAQILDVLREINEKFRTAILLISHDIGVISEVCTRVLVMYAGRIVEEISMADLLRSPSHPYTRSLMAAVPGMSSDRTRPLLSIPGQPPEMTELPPGCAFSPRCPDAIDQCFKETPPLENLGGEHRVACWVAARQANVDRH